MNQALVDRLSAMLSAPRGVIRKDPVIRLAEMFGPEGDREKFLRWASDETTRAMRDVLRELAVNVPAPLASADVHVQYGVTSGIQLALRILEDPTILFSQLFQPEAGEHPDADYTTNPYGEELEQ